MKEHNNVTLIELCSVSLIGFIFGIIIHKKFHTKIEKLVDAARIIIMAGRNDCEEDIDDYDDQYNTLCAEYEDCDNFRYNKCTECTCPNRDICRNNH